MKTVLAFANAHAKAIVALIGATVTYLLGVVPAGSTAGTVLAAISSILTVVGVHAVPNRVPAKPSNPMAN